MIILPLPSAVHVTRWRLLLGLLSIPGRVLAGLRLGAGELAGSLGIALSAFASELAVLSHRD